MRHVLSRICQYDQKHTLFPILHVFPPLNDVHCLVLKNNPNYVIFFTRMISNFKYKCPPPPGKRLVGLMVIIFLYFIHRHRSRGIMGIYAMDAMGNHPNDKCTLPEIMLMMFCKLILIVGCKYSDASTIEPQ